MGTSTVLDIRDEETAAIEILLEDFQPFSSEFQLEAFVIGASGSFHRWGMYNQALRELKNRYRSLPEYARQHQELEARRDDEFGTDPEWYRLNAQWEDLERTGNDCRREFEVVLARATQLKKDLGEITDELREELELDYWAHKHAYALGVAAESRSGIPQRLWEDLPGFPEWHRKALLSMARSPDCATAYLKGLVDPEGDVDTGLTFRNRFTVANRQAALLAKERESRKLAASPQPPVADGGYRLQPGVDYLG